MPNPAAGIFKRLVHKFEVTFGTAPGTSGGQIDRRVQSTVDLQKEAYDSQEIRSDMQDYDARHGVRRVSGQISGEISPGTYCDYLATMLKRDFTAVAAITGVSLTIAASGSFWTITRGAGSWLSDGVRVGMGGRLTAGALAAGNLNKNLLVVSMTATVLTVLVLNSSALTAEGPIAACTFTVQGKVTYVPQTNHTDKSLAIEHYYADLDQYELFTGCKFPKIALSLPPTGMTNIAIDVMGQDSTTGAGKYYSAPSAATTGLVTAAVNGALLMNGVAVASLTGLTIEINQNITGEPVVGRNTVPFLFPGKVRVNGQTTAYFDNVTLRDAFYNETETSLVAALTVGSGATADFVTITLPRIKVMGAAKDDGDKGLVQTIPFRALLNLVGTAGLELTTIQIQDTLAA